MRKYQFNDGGRAFVRVNKAEARRVWERGGAVVFCPVNLRPFSLWGVSMEVCAAEVDGMAFDVFAGRYEFMNCTAETGYYPAFYIEQAQA